MRSKIPVISAVVLGAVLFDEPRARAQDGGFMRGEGRFDVALSWSLDTYDEYWIGERKTPNSETGFGRINRHAVSLYAAYGVTDDVDVALTAAFVSASAAESEMYPGEAALQDASLQGKWRVLSMELGPGTFNLVAAPAVKIPMGNYLADAVTAIGDGNVDLRLRAIIQYVSHYGVYLAVDSGYDVRFGAPGDEIPIHVRLGAGFLELIYPALFYSKVISLTGRNIGLAVPYPATQKSYDRIGAGAFVRIIPMLGVSANAWTTLDGRNTGDVNGLSLGVVGSF